MVDVHHERRPPQSADRRAKRPGPPVPGRADGRRPAAQGRPRRGVVASAREVGRAIENVASTLEREVLGKRGRGEPPKADDAEAAEAETIRTPGRGPRRPAEGAARCSAASESGRLFRPMTQRPEIVAAVAFAAASLLFAQPAPAQPNLPPPPPPPIDQPDEVPSLPPPPPRGQTDTPSRTPPPRRTSTPPPPAPYGVSDARAPQRRRRRLRGAARGAPGRRHAEPGRALSRVA